MTYRDLIEHLEELSEHELEQKAKILIDGQEVPLKTLDYRQGEPIINIDE
jgi:hypothetical protein